LRKCPDHPALLELDALLNPGSASGSGRQNSAATALTATCSRRRVFLRLDAQSEQATQMVVDMGLPEALVRQVQALRYEGCNMYYTDPNNLYENVAARQQQDQRVAAPPSLPTAAMPPPPLAREVAAPGELVWGAGGLSEKERLRCVARARHACRWVGRANVERPPGWPLKSLSESMARCANIRNSSCPLSRTMNTNVKPCLQSSV
jgi:hypothetical protein